MKRDFVVSVKNMSVRFGDFWAVKNVSFNVPKGEIFGFLGANGAGKTTTIRVLCGLLMPSAGQVVINGQSLIPGHENLIKRNVGYMSQRFTLYNDLSVRENMDFAAALHGMDGRHYVAQRDKLLDFIQFNQSLGVVVKDLPGGIKQEVALCVAILHNPPVIFLDEPTAGVAPMARMRFWKLIKDLTDLGKTVFVTTHYMDEAENCNRVALMRAGELIALDTPGQLKKDAFQRTLFRLRTRRGGGKAPDADLVDLWQPYGRDWHLMFKHGVDEEKHLKRLRESFYVEEIQPSLEAVFIHLVVGKRQ